MLFPDGAMGRSAKYSSSFHSDLGVLAPRAVRASSLRNSVGASRPRCFIRLLAFFVSDAHLLSFLLSNFCHLSKKMEKKFKTFAIEKSHKDHCGIVALPSRKFLRVWKVFARNPLNCTGKFLDRMDNFQIVWIFSGWSRKFPNSLESFRIGWIFSG